MQPTGRRRNERSPAPSITASPGLSLADDIGVVYFAPWHRTVFDPRYRDDRILGDHTSVRSQHLRQLPGMARDAAGQRTFGRLELQSVLPLGQRHSSFVMGRWMGLRNRTRLYDWLDCGHDLGDNDGTALAFGMVHLTY